MSKALGHSAAAAFGTTAVVFCVRRQRFGCGGGRTGPVPTDVTIFDRVGASAAVA